MKLTAAELYAELVNIKYGITRVACAQPGPTWVAEPVGRGSRHAIKSSVDPPSYTRKPGLGCSHETGGEKKRIGDGDDLLEELHTM
jgi:hypothetical protein